MRPIPNFVDQVLREWDSIAFLAYDNFESSGRGVVCLFESPEGTQAVYVPRDYFVSQNDYRVVEMLDAYDPARELVVHFEVVDGMRSVRVRTPEGGRIPKRVWFFEMLRRRADAPEELPPTLPGWFIEACEKLDRMLRNKTQTDDEEDAK